VIGRLLLAALAGPLLGLLIAAIIEYPALLLVPAVPLVLGFAYGIITAIADRPVAPERDRLWLPPESLSPPQPDAATGGSTHNLSVTPAQAGAHRRSFVTSHRSAGDGPPPARG
jgi:hypothetical protein